MAKKTFFLLVAVMLVISGWGIAPAKATESNVGKIVKVKGGTALYYIANDSKRYVFPSEKIYKSWFTDFSEIITVTPEEIQSFSTGGNVRYRPGILLVKIQTDPKIYAVGKNGVLRWIKTEKLAQELYGENWQTLIDDVPEIFFVDYIIGVVIEKKSDFSPEEEAGENETIDQNRGLALGHLKKEKKANTVKCRAVPAIPAIPGHKGKPATPAIPAIPARDCKLLSQDKTAPVISNISANATDKTATINWTTDEKATSVVNYANQSLSATTTIALTVKNDSLVTSHSLTTTNLTASTTYYYIVKSIDQAGNTATSTERTFTTLTAPDTTAPVISNMVATPSATSTLITWTTNENATSEVKYADQSLSTATSTKTILDSNLITNHSLNLTGLTASTTYYYILKSTDFSSNIASTTEATFKTTD